MIHSRYYIAACELATDSGARSLFISASSWAPPGRSRWGADGDKANARVRPSSDAAYLGRVRSRWLMQQWGHGRSPPTPPGSPLLGPSRSIRGALSPFIAAPAAEIDRLGAWPGHIVTFPLRPKMGVFVLRELDPVTSTAWAQIFVAQSLEILRNSSSDSRRRGGAQCCTGCNSATFDLFTVPPSPLASALMLSPASFVWHSRRCIPRIFTAFLVLAHSFPLALAPVPSPTVAIAPTIALSHPALASSSNQHPRTLPRLLSCSLPCAILVLSHRRAYAIAFRHACAVPLEPITPYPRPGAESEKE
ncbi:hypothetical protein EVG20_g10018 [Dentipellis fragilis]|uniref:Uncharacterized protein n=1 Tax=Dentipellis fragilis TaxID=205917 RepID=A0A4Y9XTR6_9AGAM|nr:hypothetical protein EVG20_g10018 [Dentipellis fragilis]